ncbi:response regulator transcription factor, partial [bacterium]
MSVRVLLVDDHAVVREGYRGLIERSADVSVIAEAGTGEAGLAMYREHRPDVVVMDIALPDRSGIAVLQELIAEAPEARVLMFS